MLIAFQFKIFRNFRNRSYQQVTPHVHNILNTTRKFTDLWKQLNVSWLQSLPQNFFSSQDGCNSIFLNILKNRMTYLVQVQIQLVSSVKQISLNGLWDEWEKKKPTMKAKQNTIWLMIIEKWSQHLQIWSQRTLKAF